MARKANATGLGLDVDGGLVLANLDTLRARGVNVDSLAQSLAAEAAALPGVARVFTARSLAQAADTDRAAILWRRLIPAEYAWLFCALTKPGYVWSNGGLDAEHGSANPDDIGVPIAFYGKGITSQRIQRRVSTVDIAPTLAALLRIPPLEPLDGHVLPEVIAGTSVEVGRP